MFQESLGFLIQPIKDIGNWFGNLIQSLNNWFTGLGTDLSNWFNNLGNDIQNMSTNVGNWFKGLGDSIGNWFTVLKDSIGGWFTNLMTSIGDILSYLNPLSDKFFLKIAFVPQDGYFNGYFTDIKTTFDSKLPIIGTISSVVNSIKDATVNGDAPDFKVSLPGGKWGNGQVSIFNFAILAPYRDTILTILRVLIWLPFILKQYKRIPKVIY